MFLVFPAIQRVSHSVQGMMQIKKYTAKHLQKQIRAGKVSTSRKWWSVFQVLKFFFSAQYQSMHHWPMVLYILLCAHVTPHNLCHWYALCNQCSSNAWDFSQLKHKWSYPWDQLNPCTQAYTEQHVKRLAPILSIAFSQQSPNNKPRIQKTVYVLMLAVLLWDVLGSEPRISLSRLEQSDSYPKHPCGQFLAACLDQLIRHCSIRLGLVSVAGPWIWQHFTSSPCHAHGHVPALGQLCSWASISGKLKQNTI